MKSKVGTNKRATRHFPVHYQSTAQNLPPHKYFPLSIANNVTRVPTFSVASLNFFSYSLPNRISSGSTPASFWLASAAYVASSACYPLLSSTTAAELSTFELVFSGAFAGVAVEGVAAGGAVGGAVGGAAGGVAASVGFSWCLTSYNCWIVRSFMRLRRLSGAWGSASTVPKGLLVASCTVLGQHVFKGTQPQQTY